MLATALHIMSIFTSCIHTLCLYTIYLIFAHTYTRFIMNAFLYLTHKPEAAKIYICMLSKRFISLHFSMCVFVWFFFFLFCTLAMYVRTLVSAESKLLSQSDNCSNEKKCSLLKLLHSMLISFAHRIYSTGSWLYARVAAIVCVVEYILCTILLCA